MSDEYLTEDELELLEELESGATAAPWWFDESEMCWRLHGTAGWVPAQGAGEFRIPAQRLNHQILKAAKKGSTQAEYWPNAVDAAFIPLMRNALPRLLAELRELRDLVRICACGTSGSDYDGPDPGCPVHGVVRALNEAQRELAAVRERLEEYEAWARQAPAQPSPGLVEDGFGGSWAKCRSDCRLYVVKPGKVQCDCEDAGG